MAAAALATALLASPRAAEARPGDQRWVAASTGTRDRGVAVSSDGRSTYVLVANDALGRAEVRVLNGSTGALIRTLIISGFTQMSVQAMAIGGDTAYVAGQASGAPIVWALSISSGQLLWSRTPGGSGTFQKLTITDFSVVAAGTLAQKMYVLALSNAGAVTWSYQGTSPGGASALAAANGRVVIGGFPDFVVRVVSASTGQLQFQDTESPATGIGQVYAIALSGDRAYASGQGATGSPFTRAFDLVGRQRSWGFATATWAGTARAVVVNGTTVMSGGFVTPSSTDLYVEALDTATGSRKWLDVYNPGAFDVGLSLASTGKRVYLAGMSTRSNGDQDFVVRALGVADGYMHWTVVSPVPGNSSAVAVATDATSVLVTGVEPGPTGGTSTQAFVRSYDPISVGGRFVDLRCPQTGSNVARAVSVATLPHRAVAACLDTPSTSSGAATITGYDSPSGSRLWRDSLTAGWPAGTSVVETRVAATAGQVVAIASLADSPTTAASHVIIRAYDVNGTAGSPFVLWTDRFDGANQAIVRIGAEDGIVVAAAVVGGAFTVWKYDLRSCRSGCRQWTDHPLSTPEIPSGVDIQSNRAAVAFEQNSVGTVVYDSLASGPVISRQVYSSTNQSIVHDVALSGVGVYSSGTGAPLGHTYYAARYTLGAPGALAWFDDRPMLGTIGTMDGWGVAVSGDDRAYACGYTADPRRHVVRGYDAAGTRLWEAQPTLWPSGSGACAEMAATASRVFVAGNDSANGNVGSFLVASFDAATGADDWVDRSLPPAACSGNVSCTALTVATDADYLVAGGQSGAEGPVRIYEAVCARHGTERPCH